MSTPKAKLKTMPTGILKNEAIFNEALILMEALLYRGVITRAVLDPAGISPNPVNGDIYFVPDGSPNATGDWSGQGGSLAVYFDGWRFIPPADGLTVWISDEAQSIQYRNGVWVELSEFAPQELNQLTDVDFGGSPQPQGGEVLVFDSFTRTWKPGQSGAVSFTKVELTGNQAVSANAAVVWDQIRAGESHGTIMWSASQPTRLSAVGRGVYQFGFQTDTTGVSTELFPGIWKNGADFSDLTVCEAINRNGDGAQAGSRLATPMTTGILEDGDYIEAIINFAGFTLENKGNTCFWMLKVGAL